jgi:hypothetical protein
MVITGPLPFVRRRRSKVLAVPEVDRVENVLAGPTEAGAAPAGKPAVRKINVTVRRNRNFVRRWECVSCAVRAAEGLGHGRTRARVHA